QLCDFAGALAQPIASSAPALARELNQGVKEWFRSCHALLIFVDSAQPEMEQVDAIDLLLNELRKPAPGGPMLERPLGLVLTKWDAHGIISDDFTHEQQRAQEYLQSHRVFRQLYQKLYESGERIEIFPVSAFGNQAQANKPPAMELLTPCHLH